MAYREPSSNNYRSRLLEQIQRLKAISPDLYECIDWASISGSNYRAYECELAYADADFASSSRGGRAELYIRAQRNPLIRAIGIRQLFNLASKDNDLRNLSPEDRIIDVLGGDGLLTRTLRHLLPPASMPSILTSDISEEMVIATQAQGLPTIRQPAQHLLFKENSFNAVIIAYGTHHVWRSKRLQMCREAFRVLKAGGRLVLHDFEENCQVSKWFREVVDRYSLTRHNMPHFSAEEMRDYLATAGFKDVKIQYLYDPFILWSDDREQLETLFGEHLLNMYALVKLADDEGNGNSAHAVYALAEKYFQYDYERMGLSESFGAPRIQIFYKDNRWCIEMPRVALIGSATKP